MRSRYAGFDARGRGVARLAVGLGARLALEPVTGVRLGTASLGERVEPRPDVTVMALAPGTRCAGRFTRNLFCAAPVVVAREFLNGHSPRYLLINAGNANAGTGAQGLADARACCRMLAERVDCAVQAVLPFSTGVVGEPLCVENFSAAIGTALGNLTPDGWQDAARAIMTTDTLPKGVSRRFEVHGHRGVVTGIVKGAGMIRPDMATMLAFIATDAEVAAPVLDDALGRAVEASFNRITVDGDTSTNDACVLLATGADGAARISGGDVEGARAFREVITDVCTCLAQAVVRDAEGATKFVTIRVSEGRDEDECLQVAYTIAHSPLVKTAMYASDANWGRILAAVGRAGLPELEIARVAIALGDVAVVANGERLAGYRDEQGQRVMAEEEIKVSVALGRGQAEASVWTSDLSHEYVTINAEYRS